MPSVCRSRLWEVLAWILSYSIWILGGSIQGEIINGIIFSTDSKVIFYCDSNYAVGASWGVSLCSLRLYLICVRWEYLIDVVSLNRLFPINISRRSLSGKIPASISGAGLDVALYTPVIIRMALVCIDFKVANRPFWCLFSPREKWQTKHAYVSCGTKTAKYIWRNFKRLPPYIDAPSLLNVPWCLWICF